MKIRNGFVSNSSSSSFIILKDNLTSMQISLIKNNPQTDKHGYTVNEYDMWTITEDDFSIKGKTWMDNYDFSEFLTEIGVKPKYIKWGADYE